MEKITVRCKFIVERVSENMYGCATIHMIPVTSGSEENKKFWEYTPSGKLEISTTNKEAFHQFEIGGEYYIDITKA